MKETLSASKIKVLKSCSWQYWSKYHLKLPDKTNSGALKGDTVHIVLECLGSEKHKKHYDAILKKKDISASKAVKRLVYAHIKRKNLNYEDDLADINEMITKGISYDFFGNKYGKPTESISEKDFEIEVDNENFKYKVKGFIDKLFIYGNEGLVLIRDFKTNKKMYEGKEVSDNLQDYIYTLAIHKLFPQYKNVKMEFLFLKQDIPREGVMLMESKSKQDIDGFQYELSELQTYADKFNEKLAVSNLAFNQGMPKDGSFSGKLLCGFASKANQLKKDGSPMWYCSFKFGFDYYVVLDKDGKIKKSAYTKKEFDNYRLEPQEKIEKRVYDGCPCFQTKKTQDEFDLDKF